MSFDTKTHDEERDNKFDNLHKEEVEGLHSKLRSQIQEIRSLREQIVFAHMKDMLLLKEKYTLGRKLSDLRMAIDEQKQESITSVLNELSSRKSDVERNLSLTYELKAVEDERHILLSSLLSLLGEYAIWPRVASASAICDHIKVLHDGMVSKLEALHRGSAFSGGPDLSFVHNNNNNNDAYSATRVGLPSGLDMVSGSGGAQSPLKDGPGIEGFQIIGEPWPGRPLLGCGYPVRGTSLCMFQWIRHLDDGTRHYIEGATNPEYVVTADDVDKLLSVECIPMDETGRQGDLVRIFANNHRKIACDVEMQMEMEGHLSRSHVTFPVLLLSQGHVEQWVSSTLTITPSRYQVKVTETGQPVVEEIFSSHSSIRIPSGLSSQFVLISSDDSSYPFTTYDDVRARDIIVLTFRAFQAMRVAEGTKLSAQPA